MIAAAYFVVGIAFALWAAGGFEDRSQWIVVAPMCVLLWPLFVLGIASTWAWFELRSALRRRTR